MKLALLLLLSSSAFGAAVLTDDVYQIPGGAWRFVSFEIRQRPATVQCRYDAAAGDEVSAELVNQSELELIRQRKFHDSLASADSLPSGVFRQYLGEAGQYAVVIQNGGKRTVAVHLRVALDFGASRPVTKYLSPERRLAVILVSCASFFAIVTFSARALLKAMKRYESGVTE
jgi:hypothetical protein